MDQITRSPVSTILQKLIETPFAPDQKDTALSPRPKISLVLAANEISFAHGTGVLLARILSRAGPYVTIRTQNDWAGKQAVSPVADYVLRKDRARIFGREEVCAFSTDAIQRYNVDHILSVPYYRYDIYTALAVKAATGAPMTVYVMDDNTLYNHEIPPEEMAELVGAADARFAISSEMRTAYQNKFRQHFFVMPPIVANELLRAAPSPVPQPPSKEERLKVALVGNIWHQNWLDLLIGAAIEADISIVWLTSSDGFHWLKLPEDALRSGHLVLTNRMTTKEMVAEIEKMHAVVIPSGNFEEEGHSLGIAKLSLPSRMPFVLASAGTPMLVLGHPQTCAARFIRRFKAGLHSPYDGTMITNSLRQLLSESEQRRIRQQSFELAPLFSDIGAYQMLRQTAIQGGAQADDRFEQAFALQEGDFAYYIAPPTKRGVVPDQVEMMKAFERVRARGYSPDFVLDVGASSGIWSYTLYDVYPDARYVLVDPLISRYSGRCFRPGFETVECATGDAGGVAEFQVSRDLYGSSLVAIGSTDEVVETIRVPVRTLDNIAREYKLRGRGVLKLDIQFSEHLAIAGATELLATAIDIVVIEVTLEKKVPDMLDMRGITELLANLGFIYFDEVGEWRNPQTGRLEQKDIMFAKKELAWL